MNYDERAEEYLYTAFEIIPKLLKDTENYLVKRNNSCSVVIESYSSLFPSYIKLEAGVPYYANEEQLPRVHLCIKFGDTIINRKWKIEDHLELFEKVQNYLNKLYQPIHEESISNLKEWFKL